MKVSHETFEKIKMFEGCRLKAYKCSAGVWTIGYGHTMGVKEGMTITQQQADDMLLEDLRFFEEEVAKLGQWTQNQFDALVDFSFNLGIGNLKKSTLLKKIRAGANAETIAAEFFRWVHAGGRAQPGLMIRRLWDAKKYNNQ